MSEPSMDLRSMDFLKKNNIDYGLHTPKKINKKMLNYFDKFLAVDMYILNHLNITYPKYRHKFNLLTMQFSEINIADPYRFDAEEYSNVMNDIKYVTKKINLEKILYLTIFVIQYHLIAFGNHLKKLAFRRICNTSSYKHA